MRINANGIRNMVQAWKDMAPQDSEEYRQSVLRALHLCLVHPFEGGGSIWSLSGCNGYCGQEASPAALALLLSLVNGTDNGQQDEFA